MEKLDNLTIIGTSHISEESVGLIEKFIEKNKPSIVAVELDKRRLDGLLTESKFNFRGIFEMGLGAFLVGLIGSWIQKKLGNIVNVKPGSDMLKAVEMAKRYNLKLALIDQDARVTLKKLVKNFSWKEKRHLAYDLTLGLIFKPKKIKGFDIKKVPPKNLINELLEIVKGRYPTIYNVLIEERNYIMSKNLYKLMTRYPDKQIFAVVGAGHEERIIEMVKGIKG
jgi:pheromone shutdown-related protein TraB